MTVALHLGDCLDVLRTLPADSVDSVVTDPPAGIGFMGKGWDRDKGGRREWVGWLSSVLAECLRVAKPGSVLLCWAIPRTSHWTGTAIEDAGWQIQDRLAHIFGSGFPKHKSHLKPAVEDWWLARKPGGAKWLGIERCRVSCDDKATFPAGICSPTETVYGGGNGRYGDRPRPDDSNPSGRWPANLVLSHSPGCNGTCAEDCPVRLMGEQGGERAGDRPNRKPRANQFEAWRQMEGRDDHPDRTPTAGHTDSGSAARFFANFDAEAHDPFLYCPKASRKDRGEGNTHATVKPNGLMRWLCCLATPPGGVILDPFMGSGSTGKAAVQEGFGFIGIDDDRGQYPTAERRIAAAREDHPLFADVEVAP